MTTDLEALQKNLADINNFVRERFDPTEQKVVLLGEEMEKLKEGITEAQGEFRELKRDKLRRDAQNDPRVVRVMGGPYDGLDVLELGLMRGFAKSQAKEPTGPAWMSRANEVHRELVSKITPDMVEGHFDYIERTVAARFKNDLMARYVRSAFITPWKTIAMRAAMDSDTAGSGDELVATLERAQLWMDVNLETRIASLIPIFPMPSNPFDVPRQLGDANWYPGTENVSTTGTALTTGKTTLTAYELVAMVPFSFSLEEDAVLPSLQNEIRAGVVRNAAEVMDDVILNADTTTTNGINSDGATIAATDAGKAQWLLGYDGLRHLPLVDNTAMGNDHSELVHQFGSADDETAQTWNEVRALLGKYGVRPSECAYICDPQTYIDTQVVKAFQTLDKIGPQATMLTGMLGMVHGIPVIVSEQMRQTDDDGKVTDPEGAAANDNGSILVFNRTQWAQGFRRELMIDIDRDVQKRQTVLVFSFRHALAERSGTRSSATHTALQYNIT